MKILKINLPFPAPVTSARFPAKLISILIFSRVGVVVVLWTMEYVMSDGI